MMQENKNRENIQTEKPRSDWKEIPLEYYTQKFAKLDPLEISKRCRLPFDVENQSFTVRFMGVDYSIKHPDFSASALYCPLVYAPNPPSLSLAEEVLALRYLCEGRWSETTGKSLSYRELPWGELYFRNFEGRCIKRFAHSFGNNPQVFVDIMEKFTALNAEKISGSEAAYRFEFFCGFYISFILWAGDDEFPPAAQIVFDDNITSAFSAEDLAAAGEAVITRLKKLS